MAWTKADLARVQSQIDCYLSRQWVSVNLPPDTRRARMLEIDKALLELAPKRVVLALRNAAQNYKEPRERRAAARLAERVALEGLPEAVRLPLLLPLFEPEEHSTPLAVLREDSGPSPMWAYPLHARVDPSLESAYYATLQRPRLVVLREWLRCDDSEAASLHWHAWASGVAGQLGAAEGWASLAVSRAVESVGDDHPAVAHVQRVLVAAATQVAPPRGLVALDLRGLGLRCVRPLAEALVRAARDRATQAEPLRGAVLLADHYPAMVIGRLVDLELDFYI